MLVGYEGGSSPALDWVVDHVPSGLWIADFDTFEDAMAVADDLSRWSPVDPDATERNAVALQLGPQIEQWLDAMSETGAVFPFRAWQRERAQKGGE